MKALACELEYADTHVFTQPSCVGMDLSQHAPFQELISQHSVF